MTGPVYHYDLVQGSGDWLAARLGLLTASEMKHIVTPATLKAASNEKERAHLYTLLAQRIAKYVEPQFEGYDMLRGREDETDALEAYREHYGDVSTCGFITNDKWGFTIGYSPDSLVNPNGLIEAKSRKHNLQAKDIIESISKGAVPPDFLVQCHTGLLVADDREWLDFIDFSAGMFMATMRVYPDPVIAKAIVDAAAAFEERLSKAMGEFTSALADPALRFLKTEPREIAL